MIDMTNTQTLTLADFLLARIAEDEAEADRWHDIECDVHSLGDAPLVMGPQPCDCKGPARVLADCEAKRRIVADLDRKTEDLGIRAGTAARLLRYLALPYADHPDYRDEWRA